MAAAHDSLILYNINQALRNAGFMSKPKLDLYVNLVHPHHRIIRVPYASPDQTSYASIAVRVPADEIADALRCSGPSDNVWLLGDLEEGWDEAFSSHIDDICTVLATHPIQKFRLVGNFREEEHLVEKSRRSLGHVLEALSRNPFLQHLALDVYVDSGFDAVMHSSSLTTEDGLPYFPLLQHLLLNHSCTLPSLEIERWPFSDPEYTLFASALATNATSPTLKSLHLGGRFSAEQELRIIKALETNTILTTFSSVNTVLGEDREEVFEAVIDLLSVNFTLKHLRLWGLASPKYEHYCRTIQSMLEENASGALALLQGFPRMQPTSARVFFCGNGLAGKTTLQKTMVKLLDADATFIRKVSRQLGDIIGKGKQPLRTAGIDVTRANYYDLEISFWDLAGQKEYQVFHDLMFPSDQGPSLFLIVCSLCSQQQGRESTNPKPLEDMGAEMRYWLGYIASNTRKSPSRMPHVSFIFTHIDKLDSHEIADTIKDEIQNLRKELEQEFDSVIKVAGAIFFVDGRKLNAVRGVLEQSIKEVKEITSNCQPVYTVCNNVTEWIANWMKVHPDEPWMKENDFIRICAKEKPFSSIWPQSRKEAADITKAVLFDLHRTGNVIHFKDQDIVLVDIQWFCKDFMGSILEKTTQVTMGSRLADHKLGVWRREDIKRILERACNTERMMQQGNKRWSRYDGKGSSSTTIQLDVEQLINIMIQLEFCFEVNPGEDIKDGATGKSIFIPATLCRSNFSEHRRWTAEVWKPAYEFGYVGRRLECKDKNTFLTPGFFPRLQVHLKKVFESMRYYLEKDLIKIVDERMEVLIEFNEAPTSFIDIMVRFAKSKRLDDVLDFVRQRVIQNIQDLQRKSGCWQGVYLLEAALRPACVQELMVANIKQAQSVSLEKLRCIILNTDLVDEFENITYTWGSLQAPRLGQEYRGQEFTPIIELIGDGCFTGILSERLVKVEELSKKLGLSNCIASSREGNNIACIVEASYEQRPELSLIERDISIYTGLESRLERMEGKIDAIAKDLKGVKGDLYMLLNGVIPEVHKLLAELRNHTLALAAKGGNSELPQFFLLNTEKSLVYKLVPGLRNLRINFMCESQPMPHLPKGQEGIQVTILGEGAVRSIQPYLHFLLSALALGFKIGAPMCQAHGLMVPDCSPLIDILVAKSCGIYERSELFLKEGYNACGDGKHVGCDPVDLEKARIWVTNFMREKQCDNAVAILKRFGLMRKELMQGGCAWLCEDHYCAAI